MKYICSYMQLVELKNRADQCICTDIILLNWRQLSWWLIIDELIFKNGVYYYNQNSEEWEADDKDA